jgi:hypothetical protein
MTKSSEPRMETTSETIEPTQIFGRMDRLQNEGRTDLEPVRNAAALAHDVEAEDALGVFRFEVDFTGGHLRTLGHEHEVLDQLLHRGENFSFGGTKMRLASVAYHGPGGNLAIAWLDDAHGLLHLLAADQIAVVAITRRADGDVELVLLVTGIRLVLAQVEGDA